jgi:hypothetical protein
MSRQSGKNELAAQLEAYLLNLYQIRGGQIVKASPTFKPQTINSMLRLEEHRNCAWDRGRWTKREGYIFQLGNARCLFFSADPRANVAGGTASLLRECDEAHEVDATKWGKDFDPMGASTNVTTAFFADADPVGAEVPAYAEYVRKRVKRLGRNHPLIKTQYCLETIDAEAGMFPRQPRA